MEIYFVRKSKWILVLVILKIIFILWFTSLVLFFFHHITKYLWNELIPGVIVISYIIVIIWYLSSIISLARYFFDLLIITDNIIYQFKMWLFLIEDISIIEIYRIQEIKSYTRWFIRVLLKVWDIHLVEQKDKEKIIYNIDSPKQVAKNIERIKLNIIEKRRPQTCQL